MQTTTLYVELLIIGFEVYVWLGLFLSSAVTLDQLASLLKKLESYSLLVTLIVFGLAYFLGIVCDKAAHFLVGAQRSYLQRWLHRAIGTPVAEEDDEDYRQIYARIMVREGQAADQMLYARSKVRILRASVVNLLLILVAAAVFLYTLENARWWLSIPVGLIVWLLILGAYIYTQQLYRSRLERFNKYLDGASV